MSESEIVRAKQSFRAPGALVRAGDLFGSDDPIVAGREHLFESVAGAVRTTAAVPGPVASPPSTMDAGPVRPAKNGSREAWAAYVARLGGTPGELVRDDLIAEADRLEAESGE
jgi:hypothetical protein